MDCSSMQSLRSLEDHHCQRLGHFFPWLQNITQIKCPLTWNPWLFKLSLFSMLKIKLNAKFQGQVRSPPLGKGVRETPRNLGRYTKLFWTFKHKHWQWTKFKVWMISHMKTIRQISTELPWYYFQFLLVALRMLRMYTNISIDLLIRDIRVVQQNLFGQRAASTCKNIPMFQRLISSLLQAGDKSQSRKVGVFLQIHAAGYQRRFRGILSPRKFQDMF